MQKVFLILFVGVLGVCVYMHEQESPIVNDVLLKNVDALADKVANGPTTCWCSGSYTCPGTGEKYEYVYQGYGLR